MAGLHDSGRIRNKILARLPPAEAELLASHLQPVPLKFRQRLEMSGRKISEVVFVEEGLVSLIALSTRRREQAEVAVLGSEGATGCSVLLGVDRSPCDALVQVAGEGLRIGIDEFHRVLPTCPALRDLIGRYVYASTVQVLHTVIASTRGTIEERLSRWLLMAQDRLGSDVVHLTHETLAITLSVRRAGVTMALGRLSSLGLIAYRRGAIQIMDRAQLMEHAREFYGEPEAEYERVFSEPVGTLNDGGAPRKN